MTENLELRMYFFVPYNLSSIQKGIQAGHAALEYALRYGRTELFKTFMRDYKTWIILNGGTTRDVGISMENGIEAGTLNQIRLGLESNNIFHSFFREPDLNYALTAVCFIADERVWNFEKYPDDLEQDDNFWISYLGGEKNAYLRNLIRGKHLA